MDALEKEINSRKDEIKKELRLLFKTNLKITDWDIPEVDDKKAAKMIMDVFKEALSEIDEEIKADKYNNY
jgi:hypothetical protein